MSTNRNIVTAKTLDLNNISYSWEGSPKRLESGASQLYVNYKYPDDDSNNPLRIQTPTFTLPFNMSVFNKGEYPKYSIEASFRGMDDNPSLKLFYDKFMTLDEKFINDGVSHSMKWFKKKKTSKEVIMALYNKLIRPSIDKLSGEPDGKYPPTIRFKLPNRDGKFQFRVYNFNKTEIESPRMEDLLVKGAQVSLIVQCGGLWFANGRFGCTFKVVQCRVKAPARLVDYAFLSDSEDEGDNEGGALESSETSGNVVNDSDSDSDSDDSESEAEPVVPVKIVKKKRGRKKKN